MEMYSEALVILEKSRGVSLTEIMEQKFKISTTTTTTTTTTLLPLNELTLEEIRRRVTEVGIPVIYHAFLPDTNEKEQLYMWYVPTDLNLDITFMNVTCNDSVEKLARELYSKSSSAFSRNASVEEQINEKEIIEDIKQILIEKHQMEFSEESIKKNKKKKNKKNKNFSENHRGLVEMPSTDEETEEINFPEEKEGKN